MLVLFFRVIILYFLTLFSIRLMGKREIGQLQPFDLIVNMMIAELAAQPLEDVNVPLMAGILPVFVLLFLQLCMSYLSMKSKKIRRYVCGDSVIIAKNGKFNQKYMKKMLISVDDLTEMLRTAGLRDITQLDYLVVETNGNASYTEKKDSGIMSTLIENGKVIESNLSYLGLKKSDMFDCMKNSGIADVKDVFWGFYFDDKYHFIKKEQNI
ncbi:MAG: DUF421 domain-containing protein [Anaerofustis stercorihominis]|nr:DUF421 domain-containing protein [Anaerofustis stercorihominis]